MLGILISFLAVCFAFACVRKFKKQKWLIGVFFVALNLFLLEIVCYGYFIYLISAGKSFYLMGEQHFLDELIRRSLIQRLHGPKDGEAKFYQMDDKLGYTVGKNKKYVQYVSSSQGLRADHVYAKKPSPNVFRVAAFGDSFVFCDGEYLPSTWPYMLEKSTKNLEVMNFGVSGYGLGQAYMRYMTQGKDFDPDVVFFNYVVLANRDGVDPNELVTRESLRTSTSYRIHYWLENGKLKSKVFSPFDLLDAANRWKDVYAPLGVDRDALRRWETAGRYSNLALFLKRVVFRYELPKRRVHWKSQEKETLALLKNLIKTVKRHQATLLFFYEKPYRALPLSIQKLLLQNMDSVMYVDSNKVLKSQFARLGIPRDKLLNVTRHYNAIGNKIYAQTIAMILAGRLWGKGNRVFGFDPKIGGFVNVARNKP